jgi:hypothetical protein
MRVSPATTYEIDHRSKYQLVRHLIQKRIRTILPPLATETVSPDRKLECGDHDTKRIEFFLSLEALEPIVQRLIADKAAFCHKQSEEARLEAL